MKTGQIHPEFRTGSNWYAGKFEKPDGVISKSGTRTEKKTRR
jgi:hypothetical protein